MGKKLKNYKLDPTLNWQIAEIVEIKDSEVKIKIYKNKKYSHELLLYKNLKWSIPKNKKISDIHKLGDIIFVKKVQKTLEIKTYPNVNGGIIVLDPFTEMLKHWLEDLILNLVSLIELPEAKRQPGSAFKPIVYAAALENGFSPNSIILDAPLWKVKKRS